MSSEPTATPSDTQQDKENFWEVEWPAFKAAMDAQAAEELGEDTTSPDPPIDPPSPPQPPVVVVSPPPPPAIDPSQPPAPIGFARVNNRDVPLKLFGFAPFVKVQSLQTALANIDKIEKGLYKPGHKANVIGIFMGIDDPRCASQPGYSIPAGLFGAIAKQKRWMQVAYPSVFRTNAGEDRFKRILAGADDQIHIKFANWVKESGATQIILRIGWERLADWMPHGGSNKAGYHFPFTDMIAAQHHVMDVLESVVPNLFLYSDSHFRVPFLGNGRGKPPTLVDPAQGMLDPKRVHMTGADMYPGAWTPARQSIDKYLDYEEQIVNAGKVTKVPASLMAWGRWAKSHGLPMCVDEWGPLGRPDDIGRQFAQGLWQHVTKNAPAEGIKVSTVIFYHGDTNKIVNNPAYTQTLAAYNDTFGSA